MIPIRDNVPSRVRPGVEYAIIAVTTAAFLYELSLPSGGLDRLIGNYGLVPGRLTGALAGAEGPRLLGLFTSMFLHGGWMHFLGNMWFLWIFGDNVEDHLGHRRFLIFYVASGVVAGLAQVAANPASPVPMIGASGAIAGVMGAYLVLFPRARVLTLIPIFFFVSLYEIPALFFLGIWFLIQLWSGTLASAGGVEGGVAFWAHAGGFVGGILILGLLGGWRRPHPPFIHTRKRFSAGLRS